METPRRSYHYIDMGNRAGQTIKPQKRNRTKREPAKATPAPQPTSNDSNYGDFLLENRASSAAILEPPLRCFTTR